MYLLLVKHSRHSTKHYTNIYRKKLFGNVNTANETDN